MAGEENREWRPRSAHVWRCLCDRSDNLAPRAIRHGLTAPRRCADLPRLKLSTPTNGRWDLVVELDEATLADFSHALDHIRIIEGIAATGTSILLANIR